MNTLRLLYPQWQGGDIASLVPELNKEDSSLGYYLGAELLEFLAPKMQLAKPPKCLSHLNIAENLKMAF